MYTIIYLFEVKEGKEIIFEQSWAALTELIFRYEKSLGSRLHKTKHGKYIAYAQWPDKQSWKNSGDHLPLEANEIKREMRNACYSIETLYKLKVVNDKLYDHPYKEK